MKHVEGNEQRNELSRNSDDQNKHLKIKGIKMWNTHKSFDVNSCFQMFCCCRQILLQTKNAQKQNIVVTFNTAVMWFLQNSTVYTSAHSCCRRETSYLRASPDSSSIMWPVDQSQLLLSRVYKAIKEREMFLVEDFTKGKKKFLESSDFCRENRQNVTILLSNILKINHWFCLYVSQHIYWR